MTSEKIKQSYHQPELIYVFMIFLTSPFMENFAMQRSNPSIKNLSDLARAFKVREW